MFGVVDVAIAVAAVVIIIVVSALVRNGMEWNHLHMFEVMTDIITAK